MSLLPRRPGRHAAGVTVHPGWTLTPTAVEEAVRAGEPDAAAAVKPAAAPRWTATPAAVLPPVRVAAEAVLPQPSAPEPVDTVPVAPMPAPLVVPQAVLPQPVAPLQPSPDDERPSWAGEWEAVASMPVAAPPSTGHGVVSPIEQGVRLTVATPAPISVVPLPTVPLSTVPLPTVPPPTIAPPTIAPPPLAPVAQQLVEQVIRSAPAVAPARSLVRLGFADATVFDLRPDDPIARALHTVADALLSRDRA